MDDALMKIGELAGFFNVSVKSIRVYEKMGILVPAKIDSQTGYRYYSAEQVHKLDVLLELKQLGFSLAEIKSLLSHGLDNEKFMEALIHKKAYWQAQIDKIENKVSSIESITRRLENGTPPTKMHELTEEERAWLLARMVCVEDLKGQHILSEAVWL